MTFYGDRAREILKQEADDRVAADARTAVDAANAAAMASMSKALQEATAQLTVLLPPHRSNDVTIPTVIDPTGRADATVALNAFLDSLPPDTTVHPPFPGARYRCEGQPILRNKSALTLTGDATFFSTVTAPVTPKWLRRLQIELCDDIYIENTKFFGSKGAGFLYDATRAGNHGISIQSSDNIVVDRCHVAGVTGDLVYVGKLNESPRSTNITVRRSVLTNAGRMGIGVVAVDGLDIHDCFIGDISRTILDLEPNAPLYQVDNVAFDRNLCGPHRLTWVSAAAQSPVTGVRIRDNIVTERPLTVIIECQPGARGANWSFERNISSFKDQTGTGSMWQVSNVDGFTATGNRQPFTLRSPLMGLVRATGCTAVNVRDNDLPNGTNTAT